VQECTEETNRWREKGVTYRRPQGEHHTIMTSPSVPSTPSTPQSKFACAPWSNRNSKPYYTKTIDQESGYGTDEDPSEKYMFSPEVSPRSHTWTAINRSQSPVLSSVYSPPQPQPWLTSVPSGYNDAQIHSKRTLSKVAAYSDGEERIRPPTAVSTIGEEDTDSEAEFGNEYRHTKADFSAAEILLELSAADNSLHRTKRTRRGSKY
jgi:hypothetical protein